MRCLRCTDKALPDKALCKNCLPQWLEECEERARANEMVGMERQAEIAARCEETPAPLAARCLATLFDVTLLLTFSWTIIWPVIILSGVNAGQVGFLSNFTGDRHVFQFVAGTLFLLVKITLCSYVIPAWMYFTIFELCPLHATPGKLLTGLRVKAVQNELDFNICSLRIVFKLLPFLIPVLFVPGIKPVMMHVVPEFAYYGILAASALLFVVTILDCLVMLFTRSHSTLHDYITGSEVVAITDTGFTRLMMVLMLSAANVAVHAVIWGNPLLKL